MARAGFEAWDDTGSARHPAVITEAAESFEVQHRARVRRYTILMSIRIPALILAGIAYSELGNPWVAIAIIVASVPIPWIAVLGANDRPAKKKKERLAYTAGPIAAPAIEPARHTIIDG
ncbi:DUF3099 domain-containing protein [Antrihabitans stalactiti]|uniref:DUF3099 domain-containing protein n=1 Tax=Antrihabitans stalactiti TaxID=2584121 RepID=A0A848K5Q8_9NOCA|nr:DUF3099 domain-containing protein [Antrihabitans stalactiti]NMN94083.1 DUF3099 domain-containing protein [Antrihabitans stalactiti]